MERGEVFYKDNDIDDDTHMTTQGSQPTPPRGQNNVVDHDMQNAEVTPGTCVLSIIPAFDGKKNQNFIFFIFLFLGVAETDRGVRVFGYLERVPGRLALQFLPGEPLPDEALRVIQCVLRVVVRLCSRGVADQHLSLTVNRTKRENWCFMVRHPVWELHFRGLTWQVSRHMLVSRVGVNISILHRGIGVMFSILHRRSSSSNFVLQPN